MPQIGVLAQYVKDLSFENPNAPRSMAPQRPAADHQHPDQCRCRADEPQTDFEVTLRLEGKAETQGMLLFSFELVFAGVFRIQNVPPESLQPVVLIECPRLLFPFAREIVATAVRNGGFPPLLLDPIDFVGLYRQRLAAGAARGASRQPVNSELTIIAPDRVLAERGDERAMRRAVLVGHARRQRHRAFARR